jgi:TonB family protein
MSNHNKLALVLIFFFTLSSFAQDREVIKEGYTSNGKVGKKYYSDFILLEEYEVLQSPLRDGDTVRDGFYKKYYNNNNGINVDGFYKQNIKTNTWKFFEVNNKLVLEENFKDGIRDGLFTRYNCEGVPIVKGLFTNGLKTGVWHYTSIVDTNQKSIVYYNDFGRQDSAFAYYSDDILYTKKIFSYTLDTLKGYALKSYSRAGTLRLEEIAFWKEQTKFVNFIVYRENGKIYYSKNTKNDSILTSLLFYDESQQLLPTGDYLDGSGLLHYYYENGSVCMNISYENYYKNGYATYYDTLGNPIVKVLFENNKCIGNDCEKIGDMKDMPKNDFVEIANPKFGCGMKNSDLMIFLAKSVRYPNIAKENNISGVCIVEFVINESGDIENAYVKKDFEGMFGDESLRVVNLMNKWFPATYLGLPVRMKYSLPIQFRLQ